MNRRTIDLIKRFEGCRLRAYRCPAGVWTIGYGHTANVKDGDVITQEDAERMLRDDLMVYERQARRLVTAKLNENQMGALTSFCYNLGAGNLQKSGLLRRVNANPSDPEISGEFAKWNKAGGVVLAGLVNRRAAEAELYFASDPPATSPPAPSHDSAALSNRGGGARGPLTPEGGIGSLRARS